MGFSGHRLKWGKPESAKFMSLDAALKELETESVDKYLSFLTPQWNSIVFYTACLWVPEDWVPAYHSSNSLLCGMLELLGTGSQEPIVRFSEILQAQSHY